MADTDTAAVSDASAILRLRRWGNKASGDSTTNNHSANMSEEELPIPMPWFRD